MVFLSVINASGVVKSSIGTMSPEAQALADDIAARIASVSDDEKAALDTMIRQLFDVKKEVIDGQEYDTITIELTVTKEGQDEKERYKFYDDNGTWKLYQIEVAQMVTQ